MPFTELTLAGPCLIPPGLGVRQNGRLVCSWEDVVKIPKPTEEDRAYFRTLLPDDPRVDVKPMFGNMGGFVNGNMFCGLFGSDVGVRLTDAADRSRLVEAGGGPFGPAERPMGGYLTLPTAWRDDPDHAAAREWVALAYGQVAAMPPKATKTRGGTATSMPERPRRT